MDELMRKKFTKIAMSLGSNLEKASTSITELVAASVAIEALCTKYITDLERAYGASAELDEIKNEIRVALAVFEDDKVVPALDAALGHLDDAATLLAQYIEAVPKKT